MHIQAYILTTMPVFDVEDSMEKVIPFFNDTPYSHIGVVEKGHFLGVLSEDDSVNYSMNKLVGDYRYQLDAFFVRKDTSWFDALEAFSRNNANLMPVLDDRDQIMGYLDLRDVVSDFIDTPFFTEPGGIIVVEKGQKDYSFSEAAQIVESNNARLIGGFVTDIHNDVVQITLKVGNGNLNQISQTFRRYNYNVVYGNHDDQFMEDLKDRSDYLDKYLNV